MWDKFHLDNPKVAAAVLAAGWGCCYMCVICVFICMLLLSHAYWIRHKRRHASPTAYTISPPNTTQPLYHKPPYHLPTTILPISPILSPTARKYQHKSQATILITYVVHSVCLFILNDISNYFRCLFLLVSIECI